MSANDDPPDLRRMVTELQHDITHLQQQREEDDAVHKEAERKLRELRAECLELVREAQPLTENWAELKGPVNVSPLQERIRKIAKLVRT